MEYCCHVFRAVVTALLFALCCTLFSCRCRCEMSACISPLLSGRFSSTCCLAVCVPLHCFVFKENGFQVSMYLRSCFDVCDLLTLLNACFLRIIDTSFTFLSYILVLVYSNFVPEHQKKTKTKAVGEIWAERFLSVLDLNPRPFSWLNGSQSSCSGKKLLLFNVSQPCRRIAKGMS